MSTIADIVRNGKGVAGSGGAWRVRRTITDEGVARCTLVHHGTLMLAWREDNPNDPEYFDCSIGWGSVSDQGGMNTAFKVLGMPLYFSRRNGARIVEGVHR